MFGQDRCILFYVLFISLFSCNVALVKLSSSIYTARKLTKYHGQIVKNSFLQDSNLPIDPILSSSSNDMSFFLSSILLNSYVSEFSTPATSYDPTDQMLVSSTTSFTILIGFLFFIVRVRSIGNINAQIRNAEKYKKAVETKVIFGQATKEDERIASERLDQLKEKLKRARTLVSFNDITLTIPAPDNGPSPSDGANTVTVGDRESSNNADLPQYLGTKENGTDDLFDVVRPNASGDGEWRVLPVEATSVTQLFRILFGVAVITALLSILALIAVDPITSTSSLRLP